MTIDLTSKSIPPLAQHFMQTQSRPNWVFCHQPFQVRPRHCVQAFAPGSGGPLSTLHEKNPDFPVQVYMFRVDIAHRCYMPPTTSIPGGFLLRCFTSTPNPAPLKPIVRKAQASAKPTGRNTCTACWRNPGKTAGHADSESRLQGYGGTGAFNIQQV